MNKLVAEGTRLKILLPKPGLGAATVVALLIFILAGLVIAGVDLSLLNAAGGLAGLIKEPSKNDVVLIAGLGVMAFFFVVVPLLMLAVRRRIKDDWLKPHAFVFDNAAKRLEVYENENSISPEAWLPYAVIATFDLDSYTVSNGSGATRSSRTYYVARMVKRDGSTWDLCEHYRRPEVEAFLSTLTQFVGNDALATAAADQSGALPPAGFEGSSIRRVTDEQGPMFLWRSRSYLSGIIAGLIVVGIIGVAGLLARQDGINLFLVLFFVIDGVIAVALLSALIRAIGRLNSDEALRFGAAGLETGIVQPRNSSNFKLDHATPYGSIARVSFSWKQRRGDATAGSLVIMDRETNARLYDASGFLQQRRIPNIAEVAKLLKIHSSGVRVPLGNLRLSDAVRLEAAIEDEINKRGGNAQ